MDKQLISRLDEIRQTTDKITELQKRYSELESITSRRFYFKALESIADCLDSNSWVAQLEIKQGDYKSP